jgi:AraC-like DNA-binding protein
MKQQQRQLIMMLLAYAVQRDIDQERLCSLSGIDPVKLLSGKDMKITETQLSRLWENAVLLSGDDYFGLHLGAAVQMAALGVVGAVIQTSATVGEAISIAGGMTPLLTGLFTMEIEHTVRQFFIHFRPVAGVDTASVAFRQTLCFFMTFTVQEMDGLLLAKVKPEMVRMGYALPDISAYEQALRCRPAVRKGQYTLGFSRSLWDEKILTADYEMQAVYLQKVQTLMSQKHPGGYFGAKVYGYLMANAYLGVSPLEDIAASFNLSARSVQRKLKDEGTGYQQIADNVRQVLAEHYLSSGNYQVKEISGLLGYNEVSAFTRAFKKWTGNTPTDYTA